MKKALLGTVLASGLLLATPATFAGTGYVGIDYQLFTAVIENVPDLEPEAVALRIGGHLNDNFQLERRIGSGTKNDSVEGESLQVDNIFGFYLKGGVDLANMFFPYLLLGYTKVEFQSPGDIGQTESDMSYGFGGDLHFGSFQIGAEWMMAQDKTDYELKMTTLSAAWRF